MSIADFLFFMINYDYKKIVFHYQLVFIMFFSQLRIAYVNYFFIYSLYTYLVFL